MVDGNVDFLFYVMFWTIISIMLVLLFALKQVMRTQNHLENIDSNLEKMVKKTLLDEERIIDDIEVKSLKKRK